MGFFHGEHHHVWTYCTYLGPYSDGARDYDLGVYVDHRGNVSLAAVWGVDDYQYSSGYIIHGGVTTDSVRSQGAPIYREAHNRYLNLTAAGVEQVA